jgi:hypothetical protein
LDPKKQLEDLGVEKIFFLENEEKPYNSAIKNLGTFIIPDSFQELLSPSEQLRCLQLTHALMRSTILEYHKVSIFKREK